MTTNKVTLRTAFEGDVVILNANGKDEVRITHEGTEFPSRVKADEAIEAARQAGTRVFEVPVADESAKTEGGNG